MTKSPDAFRTISEVADWLGIQAHVLRFWESKFTQVKPVKRAGGRRYYRPSDMMLIGGIKKLLHDDGLTIKGVQKILREHGVAHVSTLSQSLDEIAISPAPIATLETPSGESDGATIVSLSDARRASDSGTQPAPEQIGFDLEAPAKTETEQDDQQPDFPKTADILPELEAAENTAVEPTSTDTDDQHGDASPTDLETPAQDTTPVATSPSRPVIPTVDVCDPPADDQIDFTPGPLTQLAAPVALSAEAIAQIAELNAKLEQLHGSKNNVTAE